MTTPSKPIPLHPGDSRTRATMRDAHDAGRHGDGSKLDVLTYWASICADCAAVYRYEHQLA